MHTCLKGWRKPKQQSRQFKGHVQILRGSPCVCLSNRAAHKAMTTRCWRVSILLRANVTRNRVRFSPLPAASPPPPIIEREGLSLTPPCQAAFSATALRKWPGSSAEGTWYCWSVYPLLPSLLAPPSLSARPLPTKGTGLAELSPTAFQNLLG